VVAHKDSKTRMLCRSRRGKEDGIVAKVEVRVVPQGRGYRLDLYHEGV
jgi:hypothetical protein